LVVRVAWLHAAKVQTKLPYIDVQMCESGHIYKTCHFVSVTSFFIGFCPTRRNVKLCRFMEQSIYPLFVSCPVSKGHNLEQATDGKDKNCSHFGPMKQLREARYMGEGRMVY
jgi:hypothetical protein